MAEPLLVGNCSGFYGDRLSAMRELLTGTPRPDVLTGDYLAELTMLILGRDQLRDPALGYARTFVRQAEDCLGELLEGGTRLVANAGGLNPAGLAARLREVADGLGLAARVAHVEGDDLRGLSAEARTWSEGALTAHAYLGAAPIAAALAGGADVVVTGRCADASLVVGPALHHHGWSPDAYDALAGATVAGHVLECGTHATGGNFSGFLDGPRDARPLGFPLAWIHDDGSSVVRVQDDAGGAVTVDTVTAQLLYEVQSTRYLTPDVTVDLDSVRLTATDDGVDGGVRIGGTTGQAPPADLKVSVTTLGGHRNHVDLVLTGLDLPEKEAWVRAQLEPRLRAAEVTWTRSAAPDPDADTQQGASLVLRCAVRDPEKGPVDRAFTAAVVELALGSYPGFAPTAPPAPATPYGVHHAAYVDRALVAPVVVHHDGRREPVSARVAGSRGSSAPASPPRTSTSEGVQVVGRGATSGDGGGVGRGATSPGEEPRDPVTVEGSRGSSAPRTSTSEGVEGVGRGATSPGEEPRDPVTVRVPLGRFVHARSGDKGGDANLGLWVRHDDSGLREARVAWLLDWLTPDVVRRLVPEAGEVELHPLPHLGGVNVLLPGLLGEGVAASVRFDPQAKGLGEWVRGRTVDVPEELV